MPHSKMGAYSPRVKTSCKHTNAGMKCITIKYANCMFKFLVTNYTFADMKVTSILLNNTSQAYMLS